MAGVWRSGRGLRGWPFFRSAAMDAASVVGWMAVSVVLVSIGTRLSAKELA